MKAKIFTVFFTVIAFFSTTSAQSVPTITEFNGATGKDSIYATFQIEAQGPVPITIHYYVTEAFSPDIHLGEDSFELPEFLWGGWMTVYNLQPSTDYVFHVWGTNAAGSGPAWEIDFQTDRVSGISKALSDATQIIATGKTLQIAIPQEFLGKSITVTTMSGQAVLTQTLTGATQRIALPGLSSGIYIVSVGNQMSKKITISNY